MGTGYEGGGAKCVCPYLLFVLSASDEAEVPVYNSTGLRQFAGRQNAVVFRIEKSHSQSLLTYEIEGDGRSVKKGGVRREEVCITKPAGEGKKEPPHTASSHQGRKAIPPL